MLKRLKTIDDCMKPIAEQIKDKLEEGESELVPVSYDIVGNRDKSVAIVEISEELESKKRLIGEAILKLNKNVKSVLNKLSGRKGVYRLKDYDVIAGIEDTEVLHREHGYKLRLDPRKVFFSPREMTERMRISKLIRAGETVLVMFSGVGSYAISIGKKQSNVEKIVSVEINPVAVEYMKGNIRMNKLSHKIIPLLGDVKDVCPKYYGNFDRVVMPLAVDGWRYLDIAFQCLKTTGGIVHFYYVAPEINLYEEAEEIVKGIADKLNKKFEIITEKIVLPFGSRKFKIVLDILVR